MAQGDVNVVTVEATETAVDTAVTALRVSANDKWGFLPSANGQQITIIHIEEA